MMAGPWTISVSAARSMIAVSISWRPSNEQMRVPDDTALTAVAGRLTTVVDGRRACTRTDSMTQGSPVA